MYKHGVRHNIKRKSEMDIQEEGGGVRGREEENKGVKERCRLLTKFQYTMTHYSTSVCLAGRHIFTPQQLPSAV